MSASEKTARIEALTKLFDICRREGLASADDVMVKIKELLESSS